MNTKMVTSASFTTFSSSDRQNTYRLWSWNMVEIEFAEYPIWHLFIRILYLTPVWWPGRSSWACGGWPGGTPPSPSRRTEPSPLGSSWIIAIHFDLNKVRNWGKRLLMMKLTCPGPYRQRFWPQQGHWTGAFREVGLQEGWQNPAKENAAKSV